jgi:hypothetical protein
MALGQVVAEDKVGGGLFNRPLEDIARWTPLLILGYFAAHFLIRVVLSANLETDEAQLVGHTYLALGYGNGHPPLYNWMIAGMLALTGHWAASVASVKAVLLAGSYLLAFDIMRRITGRALPGLMVACAFLLLPQVVYKSQITLAHSVLVMAAVIAALHAVVLIVRHGGIASFAWLGFASAIGALAKYNFFLALAAILIAALSLPQIRARLVRPGLAVSAAVFGLMFTPHLIWAVQNWAGTTSRLYKMERVYDAPVGLDLPYIGLDGLIDLVVASLAWAGPLLVVWFTIRALMAPAAEPLPQATDVWRRFFARVTLIGLGAFALIILAGDMHAVYERYLTPVLIPLPFWLALACPLEGRQRAPVHFARIAGAIAVLMLTAWPLWAMLGREQLAYPYAAIAETLGNAVQGPFAVLSQQDKYAANIAIRLDRASGWDADMPADQVVVLWDRGKTARRPDGLIGKLGSTYEPRGAEMDLRYPYQNFSGIEARLKAQLYARKP